MISWKDHGELKQKSHHLTLFFIVMMIVVFHTVIRITAEVEQL